MALLTPRERVRAVIEGERPDRVPLVESGFDQKIIGELLGRELPAANAFDNSLEGDDIQDTRLDVQLELNPIIGRDMLGYGLPPPVPARQTAGQHDLQFYGEGGLRDWADLERLVFPDLSSETIRAPIQRHLAQRGDYYTTLGTRVGMSASYLAMGMEHFFLTLHDDPLLVAEILRRYTDYSAQVVYLAAELGFDAISTADDLAGKNGVFWSPAMFREIFWPHVEKFAAAVRDTGIVWIFHSDGDLWQVLPELVDFGITVLNPIEPQCMDIRAVRQAFPELALFGNVDVDLLSRGTPAEVRATVRGLIRDLGPAGRYGVASGNSVPRYAKIENVRAMIEAVGEFGAYPIAA